MILNLGITAFICILASQIIHSIGIRFAYKFNLLDHPSPRRRHRQPTPIVGGVGIIFNWSLGLAVFSLLQPDWFFNHLNSLVPIACSSVILLILGIVDDVHGLHPKPKLLFQVISALIVIAFEPNLHSVCMAWKIGIGNIIWFLAVFWIVGITNAINLIDGLDGLAGGTAFLVSLSIAGLSFITAGSSGFQLISMTLLATSILGFLRFNWSPARIFLGDNGSLPLGFLIAVNSLTCHPPSRSWVMVASIVLMLGYPILDMGLAVLRRYRNALPLFKADRNHLHFRVQRLGLNVSQTSFFLLTIGLYLQITSLCLNFLSTQAVIPSICLVLFSIFSLLYLIRCIEMSRVQRLAVAGRSRVSDDIPIRPGANASFKTLSIEVKLGPIFEVALSEEKERYLKLVESLEIMLNTSRAKNEAITFRENYIRIDLRLTEQESILTGEKEVRQKYQQKLESFCSIMDLQCSMSTIPIKVKVAS